MPPLTQAQWRATSKANRGGWTYSKYLRWWNRTQRGRQTVSRPPQYDPLAPLSVSAMEAMASREAGQALDPMRGELERLRAQTAAQYAARSRDVQGFGKAGAELLKPIGPAIQAGYSSAAGETAAFAKGYADAGTQLAQASAQGGNEVLQAVNPNAPAEQGANITAAAGAGALGGGTAGAALHDVTYAQGEIPAAGLAREGAAFGASASFLPGSMLGLTSAELSKVGSEGAQADQELVGKLADLEAQRPDMVNKILDSLRSNELQKIATSINQQYLGIKKQTVKLDAATTALKAGLDSSVVSESLSASNGYLTNKYGAPILQNGQRVPYKKYVKPTAPKAAKASKLNSALATSTKQMFDDAAGFVVTTKGTDYRDPATYGKTITKPKYTYKQARDILWAKYGVPLMGYASQGGKAALKKRIEAAIKSALGQIGLKPPKPPKRSRHPTTAGFRP